jgi:hypothetical protein
MDFRQPKEPLYEDSTAAATAACGFIEIAKAVDELEKDLYLGAAVKLLRTLDESRSDWTENPDCILTHGSAAYHNNNRHTAIIYGDYYFIEAVFKLKGGAMVIW